MKIAVTGTVASGKSSVCQILKEYGAYVVSADNIVHKYLTPNTEIGKQIVALLGSDIVVNGTIDRKMIAKKVFNNRALLLELEHILHPAVRQEIMAKSVGKAFFVAEIPLLFECGWEKDFDLTLAVLAKKPLCKKRFDDGDTTFEKREERMFSSDEKRKKADVVIENNGSLRELKTSVTQFIQTIKGRNADGQ